MKLVEVTTAVSKVKVSINPAQVLVEDSDDLAFGCRVIVIGGSEILVEEPYADVVSAINEALAPVPIKIPAMMGMPAGLAMPQGMLVK